MHRLRGAAALAVMALAGCATTPPPASVPTNLKNGQSWVITRQGIAEQVLDTCSRDSPARHPPDHRLLDTKPAADRTARIPAGCLDADHPRAARFRSPVRGVVIQGQQLIYINAFKLPNDPPVKPAKEAIRVCDGGSAFWGALYDPQTGAFSQIAVNGTP